MRRRVFALVVPLLLLLALPAYALEARSGKTIPNLYFDGTTAICTASCKADNTTDKVEGTLTLYSGETYIDSWSNSGTGRIVISGKCKVESGKSYKLVLTYSINGVAQPSGTATGTCP